MVRARGEVPRSQPPMRHPVACTIVAANQLAQARVLATSFRRAHPNGTFHALIVDRHDTTVDPSQEPFVSWFVGELGIAGFPHLAFRYSAFELLAAVKPRFLRHLYEQTGCRALAFISPDTMVLASLDEVYETLEHADMLLTPQVTAPIDDDMAPGERDFLFTGVYHAGFVGVAFNEQTLRFLDWWDRRLYRQCFDAVHLGLFRDQRWMSFAPAFLDRVVVLRQPGWCGGSWNLRHHRLEHRDGRWWIDDKPLRLYHFGRSSFEWGERAPRDEKQDVDEQAGVAVLVGDYDAQLRAAGHAKEGGRPYAFDSFQNGTPIPQLARRLVFDVDPRGKRWADPFRTDGADCFFDWLTSTDEPGVEPFLPRIAVIHWGERADLRSAFPSLSGPTRTAFAHWLLDDHTHGFDHALLEQVERSLQELAKPVAATSERAPEELAVLPETWAEPATIGATDPTTAREQLTSAQPERNRLPALALSLHRLRADLQAAFPDPCGADRGPFALWFVTSARQEYELAWSQVSPVWRSLSPARGLRALVWSAQYWWRRRRLHRDGSNGGPPDSERRAPATDRPSRPKESFVPDGVNVIGWAAAPTGVGEACRGTLAALASAGVPHALWSLGRETFEDLRSGAAGGMGGEGAPFDVDLFHVNADMMRLVSQTIPGWVTASRHRIGYWFWELGRFPAELTPAFDHVDEVWAPTRFCLDAFEQVAPVPIRWVPPAVPPRSAKPLPRLALGVPENCFLFFFAFDARSIPERKNPQGLLRALARASRKSSVPLHLLLKVNHGDETPGLIDRLRESAAGLPVSLSTATLTRAEVDSLFATCDAFVSLHRSEGLGLPLIEAMHLGRPVIATGYGGCADFLDDEVGWVVRHELTAMRESHGPYPAGALWAEPDVEHAAELMVRVATDASVRERRAAAARLRVEQLYSPQAAGERIRNELARILRDRRGARSQAGRRRLAAVALSTPMAAATSWLAAV